MNIDANQLRKRFLDFFVRKMKEHAVEHGHGVADDKTLLPGSSSLMPPDASTLFTSAGMHQFKDDFAGNLVHGTRAAATVQKCMRTPDLENVGRTARHHTFFEMLGFFSFGVGLAGPNGSVGFFKREAIEWIWEFYTSKAECGLDVSKLYVSVYGGDESGDGRDDEAADIWVEVLSRPENFGSEAKARERIYYLGEHDNFWPAGAPSEGPNGVCGPCSEIFYDLGDEYGQGNVETNGDRFMEIGNIVFTQFERSGPVPGKGTLTPLPSKNIDFGGGFERLVMVLDQSPTTLDSQLFTPIRAKLRWLAKDLPFRGIPPGLHLADIYPGVCKFLWEATELGDEKQFISSDRQRDFFWKGRWWELYAGHKDGGWIGAPARLQEFQDEAAIREKRIADHVRAITFCMADGILPSNDGAGYVIRRIIRRAFRDGTILRFDGPFLHKLVSVVAEHYGDAYAELRRNTPAIINTVRQEEEQFASTLERGLQLLAGQIRELKATNEKTLPGKPAFDLYQSQGLPREVVQDELAAEDLHLDLVGYEEAEREHRERSKGGKQVEVFEKGWFQEIKAKAKPTAFLGYETCEAEAKIVAIVRDSQTFDIIEKGDRAIIVLDQSPFYAEAGGQVGDRGSLHVVRPKTQNPKPETQADGLFEVADTQARDGIYLHEGKLLHGKLRVGDTVTARVDQQRRDRIRRNHSATHLMHAALRQVLGDHVVQRGSIVLPDRLRFDFSHPKALTFEERQEIERLVNEQVIANSEVGTAVMSPEEAQQQGAMALFGEKYGERVRVLSMGEFSKELCGGTHVLRTGDIGGFRIISEGSSAAGVRRVEAVTGEDAFAMAVEDAKLLAQLHALTKAQPGKVLEKVEGLLKEVKDLKSKAKSTGAASGQVEAVRAKGETVDGVTLYVAEVPGAEPADLLTIKQSLGQDGAPTAVLLGSRGEGRALLLLSFSKDLISRGLHAGKLIGEIAQLVDGRGGGKPDTAQAGGKNPDGLAEALEVGRKLIREGLGQ